MYELSYKKILQDEYVFLVQKISSFIAAPYKLVDRMTNIFANDGVVQAFGAIIVMSDTKKNFIPCVFEAAFSSGEHEYYKISTGIDYYQLMRLHNVAMAFRVDPPEIKIDLTSNEDTIIPELVQESIQQFIAACATGEKWNEQQNWTAV